MVQGGKALWIKLKERLNKKSTIMIFYLSVFIFLK